nr:hypothetical protein [Tanacetum cinerariifolium]
ISYLLVVSSKMESSKVARWRGGVAGGGEAERVEEVNY